MKIKTKIFYGSKSEKKPAPTTPFNPATDPGYKKATKLLKELEPQFKDAAKRLSIDEILASLPAFQRQIIDAQANQAPIDPMSQWANINAVNPSFQQPMNPINPVFAPQSLPMFNGQPINPSGFTNPNQDFTWLASMLGKPQSNQGVK